MRVRIGDQDYSVRFRHHQEGGVVSGKLGRKAEATPLIRHTECKILQPIEGKEQPRFISIGYARCHPNDNFNKETGRQLSLKKALEDGYFIKDERTIFWEEYRTYGTIRDVIVDEETGHEEYVARKRF